MEKERINNLKQICQKLNENEPEMDKNFWAVNMHGDETKDEFEIPKGVRIIMFCYSGRSLHVCPRFDKFNWREIFLNEDASYNYCTFLANLSQYSSLRDHFCVYEEGTTIRDLVFTSDELFRNGIYQLPVYAAAYEPNSDQVFVSSEKVFDKAVRESIKIRRISVNRENTAKVIKDKDSNAIIFSKSIQIPKITLSTLVKNLGTEVGRETKKGFTLLLLTCRTGEKRHGIIHPPTVYEELEKLFQKYTKIITI